MRLLTILYTLNSDDIDQCTHTKAVNHQCPADPAENQQ